MADANVILTERAQAWAQNMETSYGLEGPYTSTVVIMFFAAVAAVFVVWLVAAVFMNRKNRMANTAIAVYATAAVAVLLLVVDGSPIVGLMLFAAVNVAMLVIGPKAVAFDQKVSDGR